MATMPLDTASEPRPAAALNSQKSAGPAAQPEARAQLHVASYAPPTSPGCRQPSGGLPSYCAFSASCLIASRGDARPVCTCCYTGQRSHGRPCPHTA